MKHGRFATSILSPASVKRPLKKGLFESEVKDESKGKAEGLAEGEAKGKAEGLTEGKISSILTILSARDLYLSPTQKESISTCRDLALLENFLQKAATATSTVDLFADAL
jgi:flagellar biosynthesis/type III secretory pathway protein FliH